MDCRELPNDDQEIRLCRLRSALHALTRVAQPTRFTHHSRTITAPTEAGDRQQASIPKRFSTCTRLAPWRRIATCRAHQRLDRGMPGRSIAGTSSCLRTWTFMNLYEEIGFTAEDLIVIDPNNRQGVSRIGTAGSCSTESLQLLPAGPASRAWGEGSDGIPRCTTPLS